MEATNQTSLNLILLNGTLLKGSDPFIKISDTYSLSNVLYNNESTAYGYYMLGGQIYRVLFHIFVLGRHVETLCGNMVDIKVSPVSYIKWEL